MSFRKLLGVISIVIIVMFTLMLSTSYAWYSFAGGSTTFNVTTNPNPVTIDYKTGAYINVTNAIPIDSADIATYSNKNIFTIQAKENRSGNEMVATVSLKDVSISPALAISDLKLELYQNGTKKTTIAGGDLKGSSGSRTIGNYTFSGVTLQSFEIRVYLLDNGSNQSSLMDQTFKAKINVVVTSRSKTKINDITS